MLRKSKYQKNGFWQIKLIDAIRSPFNLLAFILTISESVLLIGLVSAPSELKGAMLFAGIAFIFLVLLIVVVLAIWRPQSLYYSEFQFGELLAADIFEALAIKAQRSNKDKKESLRDVISFIRNSQDIQHSRVRHCIANAIEYRLDILEKNTIDGVKRNATQCSNLRLKSDAQKRAS